MMSGKRRISQPLTVVTGVAEDKYEYLWKVENMPMILKHGFPVDTQKFEIEAGKGSSRESKWVVGLKRHPVSGSLYIHCTLLEVNSRSDPDSGPRSDDCESDDLVTAQFVVQLLKPDGSVKWTSERVEKVGVNTEIWLDEWHWCGWKSEGKPWTKFMDSNGAVTFAITLTIIAPFSGRAEDMFQERLQTNSCILPKRNLELMLNPDSTEYDFKIVCSDGKELKCHRAVLKENSEVFRAMLESGLSEAQTGVVQVSDISGKVMEVLLRYLYTGELMSSWCEPDVVKELTYAAGKYQLTELLEYLDNVLGRKKNGGGEDEDPDLLIRLLDMAKKMSLKKAEARLKERIVQFIISAVSESSSLSVFQFGK